MASPNDKDLGEQQILKRQAEYKPFTFSLAVPFFYTSNVALTSRGVEDDVLLAPALAFNYQPHITGTLYGEISLVQQFFFYDRFPDLNFTSFDAVAGLAYYLPQFHNLALRARYDFNRLTDDDFYPFFNNSSFILSAELPFRFGRAQQLALGVITEFSFASDPDASAAEQLFSLRCLLGQPQPFLFYQRVRADRGSGLLCRRPDGRERDSRIECELSSTGLVDLELPQLVRLEPIESERV